MSAALNQEARDYVDVGDTLRTPCLRCKAGREFVVEGFAWMANGRALANGTCSTCGGKVRRMMRVADLPPTMPPKPAPKPTRPRKPGPPPWNKGLRTGLEPANKAGPISSTHRTCSTCLGWLPLADFPKNKRREGGVASTCKPCDAKRRAAANDQAWLAAVDRLGGACVDCQEARPLVLHPEPKTTWAQTWRGRNKPRKSATLARVITAMRPRDVARHFELLCANCLLVRKYPGVVCPRN